jgi:protein TonB
LHRHTTGAGVQWALAVSILIHGLVLWAGRSLPGPGAGASSPAALQVVVAGPAGMAPAVEAPSEPRPQPAPPQRVHPQPSLPLQAPRPEPRPEAAPSIVPAAAPVAATGSAPVVAMAPSTVTSAPTPAPVAPRLGLDADGLRQYRAALGVQAGRFKRYPPRARESGWEGRVTLRVVVAQAGAPVALSLARSSGHELLDEAALEMMRLAAARTPLPESLRGQPLDFDLPVDYKLRDE